MESGRMSKSQEQGMDYWRASLFVRPPDLTLPKLRHIRKKWERSEVLYASLSQGDIGSRELRRQIRRKSAEECFRRRACYEEDKLYYCYSELFH
jgi:hypothetical protein